MLRWRDPATGRDLEDPEEVEAAEDRATRETTARRAAEDRAARETAARRTAEAETPRCGAQIRRLSRGPDT